MSDKENSVSSDGDDLGIQNLKIEKEDDVEIEMHCDDGQVFKAPRSSLTKNSPVFKAMFEYDTKEKQTNIVKIQNYDSKIVKKFMEVLSGKDFQDFGEEFESIVVEIFQLADYYQVEELRKLSIQNFYSSLTIQNIRDNFISMEQIFCEELKEKCVDFIKSNFIEVAKSNEWLKFDADFRLNLFQSLVKKDVLVKNEKFDTRLSLEIDNFREFTIEPENTKRFSEFVVIGEMKWRIMVRKREHVVHRRGAQPCLGLFLQCALLDGEENQDWSCIAGANLRLCSQNGRMKDFEKEVMHTFTPHENDWGFSCMSTMRDLLDETDGFLKDDMVRVEIDVKFKSVKKY